MSLTRPSAALVLALLALLAAPAAGTDKADGESRKWLGGVRPILLPEEEKTYEGLEDETEREEFRKIFWARRDPDLETPTNEYQIEYEKARAEADLRFKVGVTPGSLTDCGRVLILLGRPDCVETVDWGEKPGRSFVHVEDRANARLRATPERWTFESRPALAFAGGQIQLDFDESCQLPRDARLERLLRRLAARLVVNPGLGYRPGADGRLVTLADQLPRPTLLAALLRAPRQDFPVAARPTMFLRSAGGATYVAGLVRLEPGSVTVQEVEGRRLARAQVGVRALAEDGTLAASRERAVAGGLQPDGGFVVSFGVALRPGRYTLNVGVLDTGTDKGGVASQPLTVPDFATGGLALSPVIVLRDIRELPPDGDDPLADFQLGPMRYLPRYANVFAATDTVTLLAFVYDAKTDEAGKAATTVRFAIMKDGKPVARAEDQRFDTPGAAPSVGPVPLEGFEPGLYVAQVEVRDDLAGEDLVQEASFEVRRE
jgi:GWxTD domain-containing protein